MRVIRVINRVITELKLVHVHNCKWSNGEKKLTLDFGSDIIPQYIVQYYYTKLFAGY